VEHKQHPTMLHIHTFRFGMNAVQTWSSVSAGTLLDRKARVCGTMRANKIHCTWPRTGSQPLEKRAVSIPENRWCSCPSVGGLHHHHHHHVQEGLGMFPVPWSSKWNWSLHLFLGRSMFLRPFGLYCKACFGILFVSILCTRCSHFSWCCCVVGLVWIMYRVTMKSFPAYKTFIARKLRRIQMYCFFFQNVTQLKKFFNSTLVHFNTAHQYTSIQHISTLQYSTSVHFNTAHQYTSIQHISTLQYSTSVQFNTAHQYNSIQHISTLQYSTSVHFNTAH